MDFTDYLLGLSAPAAATATAADTGWFSSLLNNAAAAYIANQKAGTVATTATAATATAATAASKTMMLVIVGVVAVIVFVGGILLFRRK
jgi:cobalamin biosynthesis Mg chelatase CobN